ncbi:hypothetical protein [Paenibacillus sp. BK720]|uniref:hypothetical protein n=1 Tax=Paenibacillus sp. BK720 TaxID=2587092 RepID=UPI001420D0A8|nr:hypothetical protein [Paenibacillus sp. BK720]NIK67934.1 hypothetical protein [Paenibacillus sp. BK720]
MSDAEEQEETPAAPRQKVAMAEEIFYDPATLIAAAESFRTRPEVMAGALYDVTVIITRDDAEKRLREFLSREVNN